MSSQSEPATKKSKTARHRKSGVSSGGRENSCGYRESGGETAKLACDVSYVQSTLPFRETEAQRGL